MKKLLVGSALLLGLSGVAAAHPFNLRFDTRGECEKAQALVNHYDRDNVAGPIFHFLESFQCEYDANEGKWRIVDHRGDDSAIGNAWDD
jgi:hypothetical protein